MRAIFHEDPLDPRLYGRIAYLLLALPLGIIEFTFLVTAISTGAGLLITLIGIPILIATVYAWRWMARLERRLIGSLTGREIPDPYRPDPQGASVWRRFHSRLADPATWKDLVFLLLQFPLGAVAFIVTLTVLSVGAGALLAPLWFWAVPDGVQTGLVTIDTLPEALVLTALGAIVLGVGVPTLGALGRLYGGYAEVLLGSNADPALTAQVSDLRDARSRIIEAADAERRRLERDLHDGAQQRLVALALTLRVAEKRAEEGDPEAAELVRKAGEEANHALKELRDLARGIHPAILTNRGLGAALDDLAGRAAVPVEVVAPDQRLPDQVEAAAYFVVSECLANIAKHSEAGAASVAVTAHNGHLDVVVADDGKGGVRTDGGSGLQGLQDRVGALDGTLEVHSPAGAGTRVHARIPLEPRVVEAEAERPSRAALLSDADAAQRQAARRRLLRLRLYALGLVSAVILAVWGLTGAPNPWPVWPLLGIGLVAALDAWIVLSRPPLRRSEAPDEESARALRRRRRMRTDAGAVAILNLFVIGVWLAAGAGYFWPVWVLFGSAIALGLKALPWGAALSRRYAA